MSLNEASVITRAIKCLMGEIKFRAGMRDDKFRIDSELMIQQYQYFVVIASKILDLPKLIAFADDEGIC